MISLHLLFFVLLIDWAVYFGNLQVREPHLCTRVTYRTRNLWDNNLRIRICIRTIQRLGIKKVLGLYWLWCVNCVWVVRIVLKWFLARTNFRLCKYLMSKLLQFWSLRRSLKDKLYIEIPSLINSIQQTQVFFFLFHLSKYSLST